MKNEEYVVHVRKHVHANTTDKRDTCNSNGEIWVRQQGTTTQGDNLPKDHNTSSLKNSIQSAWKTAFKSTLNAP